MLYYNDNKLEISPSVKRRYHLFYHLIVSFVSSLETDSICFQKPKE